MLLSYASRASGGKPPEDAAYKYTTAVGGLVQYGIILAIVLAIARPDFRRLLALRAPSSYARALTTALGVFVVVYAISAIVSAFSDPGQEQGLTPDKWDSSRVTPYVVNFLVFVVVAPVVEELTFRGLGYSLLEPLGPQRGRPLDRRRLRARARPARGAADPDRLRRGPRTDPGSNRQRLPGDGRAWAVQRRRTDRLRVDLAPLYIRRRAPRADRARLARRVAHGRVGPTRAGARADPDGAEGDHLPSQGGLRRTALPGGAGRARPPVEGQPAHRLCARARQRLLQDPGRACTARAPSTSPG